MSSRIISISFVCFVLFAVLLRTATPQVLGPQAQRQCRCFPGDACWPDESTWAAFNTSLGGKLIATVPLAAPCHDSQYAQYNATECEILRKGWTTPETHYTNPSSIMAPFFANRSCDPFTLPSAECVLGTYVQYAVAVSEVEDVQKTLRFVRRHNIRLVIRNTGHDYNGKSTGAGSIGLWMHGLKDIEISDCAFNSSPFASASPYAGKVMKMAAGVQGFEAYSAAHAQGLVVVGGECPTVGLAGGYTQGGGHSALASKYGLSADQVLSWEVVTASGQHIITSRHQHADLFWALSGGGGGTYGVVMSMTVKVHPDMPTSGANLTFSSEGITQDVYWEAIAAYHAALPAIVDEGIMSVSAFDNSSFAIAPMTGPGVSSETMEKLLQPLTSDLKKLGVQYTKVVRQFPNYFDEFKAMFAPIDVGIAQYGGRLIQRSAVLKNNAAVTNAFRAIADRGGAFFVVGINVAKPVEGLDVYNSVNPAWRNTLLDTVVTTPWNFSAPWEDIVMNANKMTDEFIPKLKSISPGSGTYVNEADFQDPDFQEDYYGVNYNHLLAVKEKYDPEHVLYALTAVGSEYWRQEADGRLCKA